MHEQVSVERRYGTAVLPEHAWTRDQVRGEAIWDSRGDDVIGVRGDGVKALFGAGAVRIVRQRPRPMALRYRPRAMSPAWRASVCAALVLTWLVALPASAQMTPMGFPGLIQTPVARMPSAGSAGFGFSRQTPYDNLHFYASPFDWFQASVRYTDTNVPFSRSNTLHDKGINLQLRVFSESLWMPEVAVGIIDAAGTGLFSSEYVVMNKRTGPLDWSLGMGWGRMGAAADAANPLKVISARFDQRETETRGSGGIPAVSSWFSGPDVALFGGVRYRTANDRLTLMMEWEGNDYSDEPRRGDSLRSSSRVNVAARYDVTDNIGLNLTYERGDTLGFGVTISSSLAGDVNRRYRVHKPAAPLDESTFPEVATDQDVNDEVKLREVHLRLREDNIFVHALDVRDNSDQITVWQSNGLTSETAVVAGRVSRALLNVYGSNYGRFNVVNMQAGQDRSEVRINPYAFRLAATDKLTVEELLTQVTIETPTGLSRDEARFNRLAKYPTYAFGVRPALRSNIGGPVNFFVGQLQLKPYVTVQLNDGLSVIGSWSFDFLYDDLDRLQPRDTSNLPPVRTDLERYQKESGGSYLDKLEANYVFTLAPSIYGRVSGGIFEEMYGGVGAEVLYMPTNSRLAVGVNVNRVRKRDFDLRFGFQDFETSTGHVTAYYESPFQDIRLVMSAGRYLAGDVGVTMDISRSFDNGVRFGVFATKTNVSSREFGEGSFDKGVYMFIPFDFFSSRRAPGGLSITHRFILRDGGAKVSDGRSLYPALSGDGASDFYKSAGQMLY